MEKQYYTIKEVILGLRSEYLKNQEALNSLKNYLIITDSNIQDFRLFVGDKTQEEILACLEMKGNLLDRMLKKLIQYSIRKRIEFVHDCDIIFFSKSLGIDSTKIPQFKKEIKMLFDAPFIQKITVNPILFEEEDYNIHFSMNTEGIKVYKSKLGTLDSLLQYSSSTDTLSIKSSNTVISDSNVSELLEMKIPTMIFKNYHKDLLKKIGNIALYTELFNPCKRADFKFEKQEFGFLLVKTRN